MVLEPPLRTTAPLIEPVRLKVVVPAARPNLQRPSGYRFSASPSPAATVAWSVAETVAPTPMVLVALVPLKVIVGVVPATVRVPPAWST